MNEILGGIHKAIKVDILSFDFKLDFFINNNTQFSIVLELLRFKRNIFHGIIYIEKNLLV